MEFEQRICTEFAKQNIGTYKNDSDEETGMCPTVGKTIRNIIKKENYVSFNIFKNPISTNGGNYLADLMEIDIKGKTKDGVKEDNLFVKHIISEEGVIKGLLDVNACYEMEMFVYNKLQYMFDEMYNEAGVPESDRLRKVKCYDCNHHAIVLENLSRKGFSVLNRQNLMPLDFTEDAIKQLAKFHALSFALERKRFEQFKKETKSFKILYSFQDGTEQSVEMWRNFIQSAIENAFQSVDQKYYQYKEDLIKNAMDKMLKYLTGDMDLVKCLCHGDFRANNILMRRNDDGAIETITIDYQLINYNSPVSDILYFLFTGTDREFRKNHLENLKDLYHKNLAMHLQMLKLDVNNIYSRNTFEKEFNQNLEYGLFLSLYILPIIMTEDPEIVKSGYKDKSAKINYRYKDRINEVFEEFIEWGIL